MHLIAGTNAHALQWGFGQEYENGTLFLSSFCITNYSLHAHLGICRRITRVRRLDGRVVSAYPTALIILYTYLRLLQSLSIISYVVPPSLPPRWPVRQIDHSFGTGTSASSRMDSRARWHRTGRPIGGAEKDELRQEFCRTWSQGISREGRRWHPVPGQLGHCFSGVSKVIVAGAPSLKGGVVSRFQRRLLGSSPIGLDLCQAWPRAQPYTRPL